ncbi:CDP-diacylglycerol--glycerol-3-phosphate 3-phosphatidyltransferase [Rhodococcoides trifolii]|uniref:CDP-diacylglycerol--glycerol-3-phosphate 3-phosphatidyltransferase n=1 Tax=Rhodococcoides trifolii TaxID=908250 RepID=A0A917FUV3_9NOCA|nr:CDP-alcohol phosphatidyltransferase family protein [Rhodococcus trifolii]GGG10944.1 CDP-diacylglycerol--glycerol-3-phosphate 3-phosphatidyltransferase [Rhodococcus trifolii]
MTEATSQDRIVTVPNALSLLRLLGIPVFVYLLLGPRADGWALALLMIIGATDWLDGKLARLLDQSSRLGALLDPLVDRLFVVTVLVAFAVRGIIPWWVAALLIGRDAILGLTMFVYKSRGLPPPDVIYLGKAATFVIMSALPILLAAQGDWVVSVVADPVGHALLVWGTGLYVWTGALYLIKAIRVARRIPVVGRADRK